MCDPLTQEQQEFIDGLREGNLQATGLRENDRISDDSLSNFENFKHLLLHNGNSRPQPHDLFLTINRKTVINILQYAQDRNCLGLQFCFGLNLAVGDRGWLQLVNLATMPDSEGVPDCQIFNSSFKIRGDDGNWHFEHFLNFNLENRISELEAKAYADQFGNLYKKSSTPFDYHKGSLLPVKALLNIFNDFHKILGNVEQLTFRWGITKYESESDLGNFTLAIGIGDLSYGPVIERINNKFVDPGAGDCPPRPPCSIL